MHNIFDPAAQLRFQRGAEHLHRLDPRATAEFLLEIAGQIGSMPAVMRLLAGNERRLTPVPPGDTFPARILSAAP